jgi:hypothetical protein
MRKLAMSLTAAAFVLGAMAITVNAQTPASGANNLHAQTEKVRCLKGRLAGDGAPTARREGYGDAVPTAAAGALSVSRARAHP